MCIRDRSWDRGHWGWICGSTDCCMSRRVSSGVEGNNIGLGV